jgi:drug/metabolite transporter (DMT)-like permease
MDKISKNERSIIKKGRLDFTKSEIIGGIIAGAFMTFATALQQNGISDGTDVGKAGFITALYVVIVPIYALFFGKKSPIRVWISVGIAIIGFYLLSVKSNFTIVPSDLLILLCAFIFSGQIMAIDLFAEKCDGIRLSLVQFASGFIINLIFALILESPISLSLVGRNILSLLYLGVFSSGIAYTLQIIGQKNLNPGVASILLSLESVFGAIGGALIFGEVMTPREIIGSAIVFSAVILSQLEFKKREKQDQK